MESHDVSLVHVCTSMVLLIKVFTWEYLTYTSTFIIGLFIICEIHAINVFLSFRGDFLIGNLIFGAFFWAIFSEGFFGIFMVKLLFFG